MIFLLKNMDDDDYDAVIELAAAILESGLDDQDVIRVAREILVEREEKEICR